MIHVIGNISICIDAKLKEHLTVGVNNNSTASPKLDISGHGALQAISAARCGAKISLVSQISTDLLGQYVLNILRKEGVQTQTLSKNNSPSELEISINSPNQTTCISKTKNVTHLHANIIPPEHFNARNLIVIADDSLANKDFPDWLQKVRDNGAKILLCMRQENQTIAPYANIIIRDETLPLPACYEDAYLITTKDFSTQGATAHKGKTTACDLQHEGQHGNETSFDIFCGYIAACMQASLPLEQSLKIASNAAALSTKLPGDYYSAIPYLGYLEDITEELKAQNC